MERVKELIPAKIIKKHNSLTDGSIPKTPRQVLPDRLLNALYYKYEQEGEVFTISLKELKSLLGLPKEKDDERIYNAISTLQAPIRIRNFHYQGKEVEWFSAPFLCRAIKWKSRRNEIEFHIDPMIIEAIKQKAGYTPLDLAICNQFKTKYGLKLYEMYRRYINLPNHRSDVSSADTGVVYKTLEELNFMFGTKYRSPSKLLAMKETKTKPPINRGLEEIERVTGERISCFYDKENRIFIFSWQKDREFRYPNPLCIIPAKSIEPFAVWYTEHFADKVQDKQGYFYKIVEKIRNNSLANIEKYYVLYLVNLGKDPKKCFDSKINKFTC